MSSWIPVLTGLLAFVGAILGHFVAFDLNTAAKRRDVRRTQIDRFAELVSEDETWMDEFRVEALFKEGDFARGTEPSDKARAIYVLYFGKELSVPMTAFLRARHDYKTALRQGCVDRMGLAVASGKPLSMTTLPQADQDAILAKFEPYYQSILRNLGAASTIVQETLPEKSQIVRWCDDRWAQIHDL